MGVENATLQHSFMFQMRHAALHYAETLCITAITFPITFSDFPICSVETLLYSDFYFIVKTFTIKILTKNINSQSQKIVVYVASFETTDFQNYCEKYSTFTLLPSTGGTKVLKFITVEILNIFNNFFCNTANLKLNC